MSAIRRVTIQTVLILHILFSTNSAIIQTAQRNSSSKKISDSRINPDQSLFSITYFTIEMVGGQMLISQYQQLLGGGHNQDSYNNAAKVVNIEYYTNNSNTKQTPYIIPYKEQNLADQQNKTKQLPPEQPKPVVRDNDTQKKFLVYGPDWTSVQLVSFSNSSSSTNKSNGKNNSNINGSIVTNTSVNLSSSKNNSNINVSIIANTVNSFNNSIVTIQNSSRIASTTITTTTTSTNSSTNSVTNIISTSSSSSSSTSTTVTSSSTNSNLNLTSLQKTNITNQNNHNTNSSNNPIILLNITSEQDPKQQILSDLASQTTNIISYIQPLFYVRPIINSQFKNVGFYHEVPLQYYDGEVYLFWGVITNRDIIHQKLDSPIGVVLMFLERNTSRQFQCVDESLNGIQFNISCKMSRPGSYFIYVFVSNSAQASNVVRQINKAQKMIKYDAPSLNIPQPQGLRVEVVNNSLYVAWDSRANITNLTIYQQDGGLLKRQYILSNNHERFKVPYSDFEGFLPMKTFVQISHAMYVDGSFSKLTTKISQISFEALDHAFDFSESQKLQFSSDLPWKLNVGEQILINITFKEQTQSTIYITEPTLKINRLIFINQEPLNSVSKNFFKAGTILPLRLQFSQTGTHFLTVYNANGVAILNQPLYIGSGYPLIPDYKDLTPKIFDTNRFNKSYQYIYQNYYSRRIEKLTIKQPSRNDTIYAKRGYLFLLINGFRRKYNLKMFQFDEQLNNMAQNHTDDMISRNFFGDISPDGQTLENRVVKFNFTRSISQTILKSAYLTQNYLQLERSGTDLENILNKISLVIGIGINMTVDNKYVVTYLFSTRNFLKNILLPEEIQQIKQQLIDIIKQKNPNVVSQNKIISQDIKTWMQSKRTQIIFKYITDKRGFKLISGFVSKTTFNDNWAEKFRNDNKLNGFSKATYVSIGIQPIKQDNTIYQIYVLFS